MAFTDNPALAPALVRFGMNSANAPLLVQFYERAFGARVVLRQRQDRHCFARWPGIREGAGSIVLSLGDASIELLEFDAPGRPYPLDLSPYDTRFQHLGIVVTDMRRAMERLSQADGWSAISTGGPQTLPDVDGGATAFKFRDPDGHPLEFLQFAAGKIPPHWRGSIGDDIHQGIDHSAISVAGVERSIRFYESLRLRPANRMLNQGDAQQRLDGVTAPVVDVISLVPRQSTPHVELLHYRAVGARPAHEAPAANDTAATRLIFAVEATADDHALIQDPDGHFLQFECRGEL